MASVIREKGRDRVRWVLVHKLRQARRSFLNFSCEYFGKPLVEQPHFTRIINSQYHFLSGSQLTPCLSRHVLHSPLLHSARPSYSPDNIHISEQVVLFTVAEARLGTHAMHDDTFYPKCQGIYMTDERYSDFLRR
jgi:hypothetical protein